MAKKKKKKIVKIIKKKKPIKYFIYKDGIIRGPFLLDKMNRIARMVKNKDKYEYWSRLDKDWKSLDSFDSV